MRFKYGVVLAILASLTDCSAKVTGVRNYTAKQKDYLIDRYWLDAQEELEDKTVGLSATIPRDIINEWIWSKQLLPCPVTKNGEVVKKQVMAFGCYEYDGYTKKTTIKIVTWRPWTIRHEACHAILHRLGHKDWDEYCHIPGNGFR